VIRSRRNNQRTQKWTILSGFGFVQNIASPSLSHDRRINMERINKTDEKVGVGI